MERRIFFIIIPAFLSVKAAAREASAGIDAARIGRRQRNGCHPQDTPADRLKKQSSQDKPTSNDSDKITK
jgi:hypothetical protein